MQVSYEKIFDCVWECVEWYLQHAGEVGDRWLRRGLSLKTKFCQDPRIRSRDNFSHKQNGSNRRSITVKWSLIYIKFIHILISIYFQFLRFQELLNRTTGLVIPCVFDFSTILTLGSHSINPITNAPIFETFARAKIIQMRPVVRHDSSRSQMEGTIFKKFGTGINIKNNTHMQTVDAS